MVLESVWKPYINGLLFLEEKTQLKKLLAFLGSSQKVVAFYLSFLLRRIWREGFFSVTHRHHCLYHVIYASEVIWQINDACYAMLFVPWIEARRARTVGEEDERKQQ